MKTKTDFRVSDKTKMVIVFFIIIMMFSILLKKIGKKNQAIIMGVAQMAEAAGTARSEQLSGWYLTQLAANGMTVTEAKGQLRSDLESIGKTMSDEWMANSGPVGKKIIDGFKSEK